MAKRKKIKASRPNAGMEVLKTAAKVLAFGVVQGVGLTVGSKIVGAVTSYARGSKTTGKLLTGDFSKNGARAEKQAIGL